MKKWLLPSLLALLLSAGAAFAVTGTNSENDQMRVDMIQLKVGDGTPGTASGDNDAYVEGDLEVDGTVIIGSTVLEEEPLKFAGRGWFEICGDATTVNNNTVYYGPSQAVVSSATVGQITCDTTAAGSTTEATADAPALAATAIYPLGMVCYTTDPGATLTFTLRSAAAAYMSGTISVSIADNVLSGADSTIGTTAIASGATVAIAVASTADVGAVNWICRVNYAF
jgi:hypothetical protein